MTGLLSLTRRNIKIYFKDKGMFFTSLITPIILLVLYATFLKKVYDDSFTNALTEAGAVVPDALINGCVGGQLISSLLAVSCVTVAFCSNLLMVQDRYTGVRNDITITPVKSRTVALSYFIGSLISTFLVCLVACGAGFIYLSTIGWYLTFADVMYVLLDVFLLTLFGTALSSVVNCFLSTPGQGSAVGTIVSAGYGFICGAYMPISNFSEGLRNVLAFLPGTYGTSLLRNHMMRGTFEEMEAQNFPSEVVEMIKTSVDCNLKFFDENVTVGNMYAVLIMSVVVLTLLYVITNALIKKNAK